MDTPNAIQMSTSVPTSEVADSLSNAGAETQARFFDEFIKCLKLNSGSPAKVEMQLAHIHSNLKTETKESMTILSDWE